MPRENARPRGKDPGLAAGLDRAEEDCDGEQVTFGRVCAAPGLLQELPRNDVSRAWGFCDPFLGQTFFLYPPCENICPLLYHFRERTGCSHCQAHVPGEMYNLRCSREVSATFLGRV